MEEITCKRCGRCCHLVIDGKTSDIACKYLIKLKSGKTLCRIYSSRLGKDIGHGNTCNMREDVKLNFEGCPYNETD